MDSESGDVSTISHSFDCELFELKHIVVFVLELVEVNGVILNTPSNLFLGFLDLRLISLVEDLEELWVNLEVILSDVEMFSSIIVLLNDLVESFSQVVDLDSHLLLLSIS